MPEVDSQVIGRDERLAIGRAGHGVDVVGVRVAESFPTPSCQHRLHTYHLRLHEQSNGPSHAV